MRAWVFSEVGAGMGLWVLGYVPLPDLGLYWVPSFSDEESSEFVISEFGIEYEVFFLNFFDSVV